MSFGALAERPFRLLWLGRTASAVGDSLVPVALAFAVLHVGGGAQRNRLRPRLVQRARRSPSC